jgi:hypothetical protein
MAEPKPLIIDNFQQGIAASPYLGFADMRNIAITSSPGAVSVNFLTSALTQPPTVSALAYTTNTATDTFTVASTSNWYNGMAVTLNTVVTSTGISTGRVYWVGNLTATTFKLYKNPTRDASLLVDITGSNGSGTISSYTLGQPIDKAIDYEGGGTASPARNYIFILDDTGKVWWIDNTGGTATTNLIYLGNDTLTGTTGRAIAIYKRYIIVFRTSAVDALATARLESAGGVDLDGVTGWTYGFDSVSSVPQTRRPVLVGQDNILYYGNGKRVGSIAEVSGSSFDPTSGATYTKTAAALDLPAGDDVESLGELGINLLVGGSRNYIYPWDRSSPSFNLPIILSENKTVRIITANQTAYLFAGNRGNIYVTDGTSIRLYKKIPDHLTENYGPYFAWKDALAWRNQLYFSFTSTENDGDALATLGGVWAIDLRTGAMRFSNQLSYASYGGSATVLLPHVLSDTPAGNGLYIGWAVSSTYGVDISASSYYSSYAAYFVSQMYIVGTAWHPRQFNKLYIELNRPLVTGQGVKVSFRTSVADSFTEIDTFDHTDYPSIKTLEKTYQIQTEKIQFKVELTTATSTQPPELMSISLT